MSGSNSQNSLQWMVDVGVPAEDVEWLASVRRSPVLQVPAAANRVKQIQDKATELLLATIKTCSFPMAA